MNTSSRKPNIGDIFLAEEGTKKRPILIVNDGLGIDLDSSALRITSKATRNEFDVEIVHWQEAGLAVPSVVRCNKISTIKHNELRGKIGSLHEDDFQKVEKAMLDYFVEGFEKRKRNNEET